MNIETYLKQQPLARERANKNRAIGNIIRENYGLEIDKLKMQDIVGEILTLDRKWRKLLEENPELRGSDYNQKEILSQEKQIQLGYQPNYYKDNQKLKLC